MGTDIIVRDAHRHEYRLPLTEQPKPTLRQALGDKRIMAVLLMSFASGLPFNLSASGFAFQAWLASAGVDLKSIGFYSLVGWPYVFKFLWAPLLDRYLPPLLGRRRGWIVLFQACLAMFGAEVWGIEIRDVGYLHARSGAAQAWLLLGDRDQARTLAEAELADARVSGGRRALGIALRVAGLATGGADGLERLQGKGIYYGATAAEAAQTEGELVYVVGGANSAGQAALNFARHAKQVTLVVRGPALLATMSTCS